MFIIFFFFQAEDGIRDSSVTGVQTCALPISFAPGENLTCDTSPRMPMDQSTPDSWMPRKCCRKGDSATINMGADSSRHFLRMVKASSSVTTTFCLRSALRSQEAQHQEANH